MCVGSRAEGEANHGSRYAKGVIEEWITHNADLGGGGTWSKDAEGVSECLREEVEKCAHAEKEFEWVVISKIRMARKGEWYPTISI